MSKPETIAELADFYYRRFKPIYDHAQLLNSPAAELLLEVHAAFDHLSRHWRFDEPEGNVVDRAVGHLKRGTFDAFKIIVRETYDQYDWLMRSNVGIIDNGDFKADLIQLWSEIKAGASEARSNEGDSKTPQKWHRAFDLWEEVYPKCVQLNKEFFLNPKVSWAKARQHRRFWLGVVVAFVVGLVSGFLANAAWGCVNSP